MKKNSRSSFGYIGMLNEETGNWDYFDEFPKDCYMAYALTKDGYELFRAWNEDGEYDWHDERSMLLVLTRNDEYSVAVDIKKSGNPVYIVNVTTREHDACGWNDDNQYDAFSSREKAVAFLDERFHELCDKNDVYELGLHDYQDEDSFRISDNPDSPYADEWVINGRIIELAVK